MTATLLRLLSRDRGRLRHQPVDRLSQVEGGHERVPSLHVRQPVPGRSQALLRIGQRAARLQGARRQEDCAPCSV